MGTSKQSFLVVNVLCWVVGALLHPLANLLPTGSGETPKIFSLMIPLAFIALAYASTALMSRAMASQRSGSLADPATSSDAAAR